MSGAVLRVPLDLRWADTDQYGHVNNVAVVRLVEEARIRALGFPEKPEQFPPGPPPVLAVLGTGTFTIVVGQRFEYTTELGYAAQQVLAEVWLSKASGRSVTMECRVGAADGGAVYVNARVTVAIMDLETRRPRHLTDAESAHLDAYRGEPLAFRD